MENFRLLNRTSDILNLITGMDQDCEIGEIWQTLKDKRYHYKIIKIQNDDETRAILFEVDRLIECKIEEPIYIHINNRNLIFRLDPGKFKIGKNTLISNYPDTAKAVESREMIRIKIPKEREVQVTLKPLGESTNEIKVRLFDISRGGLGILVSDMNKEFMLRNKNFKIVSINDIELSGQNEVEVKYIKKEKRGIFKAGLKLKIPFVESVFDYICKQLIKRI